jgi:hypothetical protein
LRAESNRSQPWPRNLQNRLQRGGGAREESLKINGGIFCRLKIAFGDFVFTAPIDGLKNFTGRKATNQKLPKLSLQTKSKCAMSNDYNWKLLRRLNLIFRLSTCLVRRSASRFPVSVPFLFSAFVLILVLDGVPPPPPPPIPTLGFQSDSIKQSSVNRHGLVCPPSFPNSTCSQIEPSHSPRLHLVTLA